MPAPPTPAAGPVVDQASVTFRLADPGRSWSGIRLYQEVRVPGDQLDLQHDGHDWSLTIPRPPVDRMEYLFEVTDATGHTGSRLDPANPLRAAGAFGDKSVLELPGYQRPAWLAVAAPPGHRRELPIRTRALHEAIAVTLWASEGLADTEPALLLLVHDGPEYDDLAGLTAFLAAQVAQGVLPPVRAALLHPGDRNERYSADRAYTRALCLAVLPQLRDAVPVTAVVGVGASLGALAMLHVQRQQDGCLDGLFLQSGSFFHPRHDAHERRFPRFDRVVHTVNAVLRSGGHPRPVPTVMTCGTLEENLANNRIMARALSAQGYDVTLREVRDVHSYTAWRDCFDPWLTGLLAEVARRTDVPA